MDASLAEIVLPEKTFVKTVKAAGKSFKITVPGNAEPVMVAMKIANRSDRTLLDVRVNTDKQFGDFHSLETIFKSAGIEDPAPTIENLRKLFKFYANSRSVGRTALARVFYQNPVLQMNIANTGMCCYNNAVAATLAQALGFRSCGDASAFWGGNHSVSALMMDGLIRLIDVHYLGMLVYRKGSSTELATVDDALLEDDRNPYLRAVDADGMQYGGLSAEHVVDLIRKRDWQPVLVNPTAPLNEYQGTTMRMDLRPGESIEWPYRNVSNQGLNNNANHKCSFESEGGGKWWKPKFCDDNPLYEDKFEEPQMYGNGLVVYEPDFASNSWKDGILSQFRMASRSDDDQGPNLHPAVTGKPADIIWEMANPYVTVGGRIKGVFRRHSQDDWLKVYVTADIGSLKHCTWGELTWGEPVFEAPVGEAVALDIGIDAIVCKILGPLCQRYWVKVVMQSACQKEDVGIESLRIETDFLFDLHARPILGSGANKVSYRDATQGDFQRNVEVEFKCRPLEVPPASTRHSSITVPGIENSIPADGMHFFWVRVALRDDRGLPIPHKRLNLSSNRGEADEITWVQTPCRDALDWDSAPGFSQLVLNRATYRFVNFRRDGQASIMATPKHGVDDWNGYMCFMVQSLTPGSAKLTATTDDGQEIGSVTVNFSDTECVD